MADASLILFLITSLAIIATPGQDLALVMSRGLAFGPWAGVAAAGGISTGLLGHTLLAGLGLGAILQTSEVLFTVLKAAGAAYLIYLGIRALLWQPAAPLGQTVATGASGRFFFQGILCNISNPKIAIFYFAFLPQFVAADAPNPAIALVGLGMLFALLTFLVKAPVGYVAGKMARRFEPGPVAHAWLNRTSGAALVALGLGLAFEDRTS